MDLSGNDSSLIQDGADDVNSTRPAPDAPTANGKEGTNLVFQHYEPNGTSGSSSHRDDMEMS
jgi:hypothetical protein